MRQVDPFLAAARGDVVRVEIQDLFVFLEGEIVTARAVIAFGVVEQLLHVLDLGDELRAHRPVEVTGLGKVSEELERLPAIRIVAIAHNFANDLLGLAIFAFGDSLLGKPDAALAKARDRCVVLGSRSSGRRAGR